MAFSVQFISTVQVQYKYSKRGRHAAATSTHTHPHTRLSSYVGLLADPRALWFLIGLCLTWGHVTIWGQAQSLTDTAPKWCRDRFCGETYDSRTKSTENTCCRQGFMARSAKPGSFAADCIRDNLSMQCGHGDFKAAYEEGNLLVDRSHLAPPFMFFLTCLFYGRFTRNICSCRLRKI